ncbi:MAG TPA: (2Fe-2S)-binding protein [bacterium]|nr:(2Fe-2S)-binding protein [bacterium]HPN30259.1 (2Fe-2S)-binding protein [bacterium]
MKKISFLLNGEKKEFEIDPNERLLGLLRRNGYKGTKYGCLEGACGTCTVIMDGKAVDSCMVFAFQAEGREITTIESLDKENEPHEIQKALIEEGAVQCGYCTPGIVLSAKAMFDENPTPDDETIKIQMDGNFCRCTGYEKIWSAMKKISAKHRGDKK